MQPEPHSETRRQMDVPSSLWSRRRRIAPIVLGRNIRRRALIPRKTPGVALFVIPAEVPIRTVRVAATTREAVGARVGAVGGGAVVVVDAVTAIAALTRGEGGVEVGVAGGDAEICLALEGDMARQGGGEKWDLPVTVDVTVVVGVVSMQEQKVLTALDKAERVNCRRLLEHLASFRSALTSMSGFGVGDAAAARLAKPFWVVIVVVVTVEIGYLEEQYFCAAG